MIHCCQAIFALVFQAGLCTYSLENFQLCSRSSESFKMFVRNGKSVTGGGGEKNPNRFHVCVVVIKCRPVSGCAVSLFVLHTRRLQYNFPSFSKIFFLVFTNAFRHDRQNNCSDTKYFFMCLHSG